jgi:hypothetical protein
MDGWHLAIRERHVESLKIIALAMIGAVVYGVLHDQVTARVCVEYFTIGHAPIFGTDDPTLLGLGWGVLATWWVGLGLGLLLAPAARAGSLPKLTARELLPMVAIFLIVLGILAAISGVIGYTLARAGMVWLVEPLASRVPADRHARFLADLWAHGASYGFAFFGGIVVCIVVEIVRFRRARRRS